MNRIVEPTCVSSGLPTTVDRDVRNWLAGWQRSSDALERERAEATGKTRCCDKEHRLFRHARHSFHSRAGAWPRSWFDDDGYESRVQARPRLLARECWSWKLDSALEERDVNMTVSAARSDGVHQRQSAGRTTISKRNPAKCLWVPCARLRETTGIPFDEHALLSACGEVQLQSTLRGHGFASQQHVGSPGCAAIVHSRLHCGKLEVVRPAAEPPDTDGGTDLGTHHPAEILTDFSMPTVACLNC